MVNLAALVRRCGQAKLPGLAQGGERLAANSCFQKRINFMPDIADIFLS